MTHAVRRVFVAFTSVTLVVSVSSRAVAQHSVVVDSAKNAAVLAWIHSELPRLMSTMDIPGAVVVLAQHDRVLMNEGFGVADRERKTAVDASATVFRIASVAKVFTAMAALQMVERGNVTLTQDVRPLLPALFARDHSQRVLTLHQLLTHTAGFDEQLIGYSNAPGVSAAGLAEYLASSLPRRMRLDDDVPGYSNHGYGVVGLLVQQLAREPFDRYAHEAVFGGLGMTHTDFILQPTDSEPAGMAREYRSDGTRRVPRSTRAYPAGNVGTTGTDMSVFLRWLLTGLQNEDSASSDARTAHQLVGPMLTYHPSLPPMGYGLSGVPMSGRIVWMKGGAAPSHSAVIAIVPELDLALFIAVNRQEPLLWDRLIPAMIAKFWPDSAAVAARVRDTVRAPIDVAGTYRWTRAPLGSVEKILGLAVQLRVSNTPSGIAVEGAEFSGRWPRAGATTFQNKDGNTLAFRTSARTETMHLFSIIQGQPVSFERIPWFEQSRVQLATVGASTLLGLAAAGATMRRSRDGAGSGQPAWARSAVLALPVMQFATMGATVVLARQSDLLTQGPTGALRVTLALTTATAMVGLAQSAGSATLASRHGVSTGRRVVLGAGAMSGVAIAAFLSANNLITWPF